MDNHVEEELAPMQLIFQVLPFFIGYVDNACEFFVLVLQFNEFIFCDRVERN